MEFRIIDKYEDFCLLEDEWEDLLTRIENPQVFYKFQWAKNYLEYYTPEWKNMLCVVAGYENKKLIALFPFVLVNKVIRFITSQTVDYNMVYVDNSVNRFSAMKKGIEHLLENKKIERFHLNGVLGSSVLYLLEEVLREMDYSAFIEEIIMTPTIKRPTDSVEKFNKKQIANIRRRKRNLEKEHEVELKTSNILSEEVLQFITKCKTSKYDNSNLQYDNAVEFYRNLASSLTENMFVNELYVDQKLVAAHLGFCDTEKVYYYIPTYDEKYAVNGVGKLMLNMLIEGETKGREFDFLKGNEGYKFDYCDESGMIFNLLAYKKGTSYTLMRRAMNALKNNHFVRKVMGR